MADDKSKRGARDRATVSASEPYEIDYFAKKHGITRKEAQALIDRVGNDRAALDAAAATLPDAAASKPPSAGRAASPARKSAGTPTSRKASTRVPVPIATAVEKIVDAAAPVTDVVESATEKVTAPVAKAIAPAARRAAGARRKVARTAGRGVAAARASVADAPRTVRKRAGDALDSAKTAVTGRAATLVGAAAAGLVTGLAVNLGRKMVVQAPSALAGDWLEALKVEHKLALALFDQLEATDNSESGKRTVLLTQLKHALGKHAFTEENVIYPALRAWGDTADADKLNHDHGYVKQHLYDLEEIDNSAPAFLEKVVAFRAELEAHIREEEEAIFPPLHASLGDAGNAKVTAHANKEGFKLA